MARLQLRRLCKNVTFLAVVSFVFYVWFPNNDNKYTSYSEEETQQKLLVDDFIVPVAEKGFVDKQSGPGEAGVPVTVNASKYEQVMRNKAYRDYGFNQFISDKISLKRTIPDTRPKECMFHLYSNIFLKASIVIIFHNEGWSTLMRTVHSVLNRSPPSLLEEIVLVDDFSNKGHLKEKLENYIVALRKVRLIRAKERLGLIRARMLGASNIQGDVIIVLDSHCEVNQGWLPPLLEPITKDEHVVTCPIIDFIDHDNFQYKAMNSFMRGTFNWRFDYKERQLTPKQMSIRKDATEEVWSPVMAGGLFAISKNFFDKLGQYDPGMEVWGGEQYELSFKIWMCGGKMANIPCSRVGHVYRRNVPYSFPKPNALFINFRRVAEVWMDDYKNWLYERRPEVKQVIDYGDISNRIALRRELKCQSFKWYMENVANDTVRQNYEPLRGSGMVRNPSTNLCLDTTGREPGHEMGLSPCYPHSRNQEFQYSYIHEIRHAEDCIDAPESKPGSKVYLYRCHEMQGNQEFHYTKSKTIYHTITRLCVSVATRETQVSLTMDTCNGKSEQIWEIKLANIRDK